MGRREDSERRRKYSDLTEKHIEEYLNYNYPEAERVIFRDRNGATMAQTILIRDHGVRCPDIAVYEKPSTKTLLFRVEVKSFVSFRKNIPFSKTENFLFLSKEAFDQYLELQRYEEIECKIVFVIGTEPDLYKCFWLTVDDMEETKSNPFYYEDFGYECYAWNSNLFNKGLNGL
jgi:hypothetical protein